MGGSTQARWIANVGNTLVAKSVGNNQAGATTRHSAYKIRGSFRAGAAFTGSRIVQARSRYVPESSPSRTALHGRVRVLQSLKSSPHSRH